MNRKVIILVISIIVVLIILSTTTYALFFRKDKLENTESYTAGILDIVIENNEEGLGETLNLANSLPITDEEGKKSTPYKFKITNKGNLSYTFDLLLNNTTTSNQINADYIKIMVDDNEPVTLSNLDNNIIASDLMLNPAESKIISIRIWLDINTPNTEIGKSFSAKIVSDGVGSEYIPQPNKPSIINGMIPIMYNGSSWVKADSTNTNLTYKWYDYDNKQWANVVLVSSNSRSKYTNAQIGTPVSESDILAYYVWIPRYKYKVFNINKEIGTDSYGAQNSGIDIVFESGTSSTGEITCNYNFEITNGSLSETCNGSNNEYYTHPAFSFGDSELTGIWVGKFEISTSNSSCNTYPSESSCSYNNLPVRIKPNTNTWKYNNISNFYTAIHNMQKSGNEYGLIDDRYMDSHIIKNIEWGAVAYFTHSDYGRCSGGTCETVSINNNTSYVTGGGDYISNIAMSTTGNIYGIYDMSGGTQEYVMGNMSSTNGSYTYNAQSAGNSFSYSSETAKYIDTYANGTTSKDEQAYNRARLGDATAEVVTSNGAWQNTSVSMTYGTRPWIVRSGVHSGNPGIFYSYNYDGMAGMSTTARATLILY